MKTRAVRLHGKNDLRLDTFELPPLGDDEILAEVVSDSICMSSYKATMQGEDHKRVPYDVAENPVIIGHEFSGRILEVGKRWREQFQPGDKFSIQPALNYKGSLDAPGYSYRYIGGDATHIVIPNEVMEMDCLLAYRGEGYFYASLSEPMSCIVGAFNASYHRPHGTYIHEMGIKEGGNLAILGGAGPMGLGAIDYALHADRRPGLLVVTDIDDDRLSRAKKLYPPREAEKDGIRLEFVNTKSMDDPDGYLRSLTGGAGYDDVFVMAPVRAVVEMADRMLGRDGCMNFFAGPSNPDFSAEINFYNVHYGFTHIVATSGGNTDDMRKALELMDAGRINPAGLVTHIGGLNAVIETTRNLPKIPGGKKLIYTQIEMELTAIDDFPELGQSDPFFKDLAEIVARHNGLWSVEAEDYLLVHAPRPAD